MARYPTTYQINTRVWIRQFDKGSISTLGDIPDKVWAGLAKKGINYVWLMGIWETTKSSIEMYCFHPDLKAAYTDTNPNWEKQHVTGSPYAIDDYQVSPTLGSMDDLLTVRDRLNHHGMGLILDFIPNHFNAHSSLINDNSEVFLQVRQDQFEQDKHTFYERNGLFLAHGKDPYFSAWTDTVQLNYFQAATHRFMLSKLAEVAAVCDGVRCDMAMLLLPDVVSKTWGHLYDSQPVDFWSSAIDEIKKRYPDFIFIAEVYWGKQYELQLLGFDFTYDKDTLDFLLSGDTGALAQHLQADPSYQQKLVRFIENHDEPRSIESLGELRSRAAATLMATIPGMRLVQDGQWEGLRIRPPVQLSIEANELPCPCTLSNYLKTDGTMGCACQQAFYQQLTKSVDNSTIKNGSWHWMPTSVPGLVAYMIRLEDSTKLILINYTEQTIDGDIPNVLTKEGKIELSDELNELPTTWLTQNSENPSSLHATMPPFKSAILDISYRSN
ncbi:MAG: alpha-amylase family glycosyl hydrolase [Saprospiraceae bacterium]|nr:alpha-amylase family glycosyl hydrolase [Saprospiraceae bacterium]